MNGNVKARPIPRARIFRGAKEIFTVLPDDCPVGEIPHYPLKVTRSTRGSMP
jgi:hypothetical protein